MNEFTVTIQKRYDAEIIVKANNANEADIRALEIYDDGDIEWSESEVVVMGVEKN